MKKLFTLVAALMGIAAVGIAQVGEDVTATYVNDYECNDVANWTNDGFKNNTKGTAYDLFNGYFIEQWKASSSGSEAMLDDISIEQTLTSLPNGTYLFSAAVIACQQSGDTPTSNLSGVTLFAGDDEVNCATDNGVPARFYALAAVSDGTLKVGLRVVNTNCNWVAWDNAQLLFYPEGTKVEKGEAIACLTAYAELAKAVEEAQSIFETYSEVEDVVDDIANLYEYIEAGQETLDTKKDNSSQVNSLAADIREAAATVVVKVLYYDCADTFNDIMLNCEVGTKYGQYPESQMDRMVQLQKDLDDLFAAYEAGNASAVDVQAKINEAVAAIAKFYQSMILIDFSLPLNTRMWPFDNEDAAATTVHESMFRGDEGPWKFGVRIYAADSLKTWNINDNLLAVGATGKSAADQLTWADNGTDVWLFVQSDGYFHPLLDKIPCAIFVAPENGVYKMRCSISSQDADRVSKNRGNMHAYAYYLTSESNVMNQIGEAVEFNNNTDPANFHFFVNMQAGDRIAFSLNDCNISGSNGNAYSRIDTLYALGSKDDDGGYTIDDVEESGLFFYNPYTTAENWEPLDEALSAVAQVLADNADRVGNEFSQYPESAVATLDSIRRVGERVLEAQLASQPDVDAMALKLQAAIKTFYASAVAGLCIPTEEAPSDSTLYDNHQYFPGGLFYIQDIETGLYVTSPNSSGDKQTIYAQDLIDESMTEQNGQVWHFVPNDTLCCYAIASHANDGTTWTVEEEAVVGADNSSFLGWYHISDSPNGRFGTAYYPVQNETDMYWRTFRIWANGNGYSLIAGKSQETGWVQVLSLSSGKSLAGTNGGARNFCWNLIPFEAPDGISNVALQPVSRNVYNVQGVETGELRQGVNIIRTVFTDGTVRVAKILVK